MSKLLMLAVAVASPSAWAADCPQAYTSAELSEQLDAAEAAYIELEIERFTQTLDAVGLALPCVQDPLGVAWAAHYHRLQGLRQYTARNEQRAVESFAAARSAEPDYEIPLDIVPMGHELRDIYGQLPLENGGFEIAPEPVEGELRFDGQSGLWRPKSWPTVIQVLDGAGAVSATDYLYPNDALPGYEAIPPEPLGPIPSIPWIRNRKQLALMGTSLGAAVASGVAYSLSAVSAASFDNELADYDFDDLSAHQGRTNGLVVTSAGFGAVAVGAGVTAVFAARW